MSWSAIVETNTALAEILGVSQPAVVRAEREGRIERTEDGCWDVVAVLLAWRANTDGMLQRRGRVFRPWLDPQTPLTQCIWAEVERRARAAGADVFWEDDDESDQDWEDDGGDDESDEGKAL